MTHGNVRLAAFEPSRITHPATREIAYKTELVLDPEIDAAFPKQRAARVRIETYDGRSEEIFQPTRKGDPDAPLSDTELDEKFRELAAPVLGATQSDALLARLWTLENAGELANLCTPRA
jgi:2-methylcitrate dehydratase PrpD